MPDNKNADKTPEEQIEPEGPEEAKPSGGDKSSAAPAKRSWRKRLALPVIIIAAAGMVAYWTKTKPVEIVVVYDLGKHAPRASRLSVSFQREGGGTVTQPVHWEFPAGSKPQRRHRHKLEVKPGTYVVRARLSLRALGDRPAEVRKVRRSIKIASGQDQRITLRFR